MTLPRYPLRLVLVAVAVLCIRMLLLDGYRYRGVSERALRVIDSFGVDDLVQRRIRPAGHR